MKETQLELAFFGGSFTALHKNYMISLLETSQPFVTGGIITGIRISTRPDAIDKERLQLLKSYGVSAIELGAQSMIDAVLDANRRGHTAQQVRDAAALIIAEGFELGLQMMTGLYQDTIEGAKQTAIELAACQPNTVRIYPTIIMKHTHLGDLYENGQYHTLNLEETIDLCSDLLEYFENKRIKVIRLGLHSSPELERDRLAGPWHPAFGELCESRRFRNAILRELQKKSDTGGNFILSINSKDRSKAVGQKKSNLQFFSSQGYQIKVMEDQQIEKNQFDLKLENVQ